MLSDDRPFYYGLIADINSKWCERSVDLQVGGRDVAHGEEALRVVGAARGGRLNHHLQGGTSSFLRDGTSTRTHQSSISRNNIK